MPGAAFSLSVDLDLSAWQGLAQRLRAFPDHQLDAANDEIGDGLVSSTKARFHAQHDPLGNPWKPSERAIEENGETLIDKSRLIGSLTHNVLQGQGVEWGSPMRYARVHQDGATFTVYPRSQKTYRRYEESTGASGATYQTLMTRFVKKSRANFEQWNTIGEHTVHIGARPYLGIDFNDERMITTTYTRHLAAALTGQSPGMLT